MQYFFTDKLKNGVKVLYNHDDKCVVTHCALMLGSGTRDESTGKEGLAHFIEHTLFKGTKKRKAYHILNCLETVGGELNAYTTKEETCLHATVMNQDLERAAELISDIVFNANFPEKELQKEKDVVIDEIHAYEDTPYEQIYDDFETLVFKGHTLGHPILGTVESVQNFKRKDILEYIKRQYHDGEMIFAVGGGVGKEKVMQIAEKYFSKGSRKSISVKRKLFKANKSVHLSAVKNTNQIHYITGCPAFSLSDKNRYTLILLNNILGGPGMNSKLNLNIREKFGYTYTIESGYHAYSDTGLFHIYFATDKKNFSKVRQLLDKELLKLIEQPMSERQFAQYKKQLIGQIVISQENRLNLLLGMAKSMLYFNKTFSLKEVSANIENISLADFIKVAKSILNSKHHSSLTYLPNQ